MTRVLKIFATNDDGIGNFGHAFFSIYSGTVRESSWGFYPVTEATDLEALTVGAMFHVRAEPENLERAPGVRVVQEIELTEAQATQISSLWSCLEGFILSRTTPS